MKKINYPLIGAILTWLMMVYFGFNYFENRTNLGNKIYKQPNSLLTPGIRLEISEKEVCQSGYAKKIRNTSQKTKNETFERYNIPKEERKNYVIDHLISLKLGGSDTIFNLWPQPKEEGKLKDRVEWMLSKEVCDGNLDLKEAQKIIKENWPEYYIKNIKYRLGSYNFEDCGDDDCP